MRVLKSIPWEGVFWLVALIILATADFSDETHVTLCPFRNLGFEFCPGCGLGRSISCFFHGEFMQSLSFHPLGIFAVFILSFRTIQLTKLYLTSLWQK
jgi:hypothetical protein